MLQFSSLWNLSLSTHSLAGLYSTASPTDPDLGSSKPHVLFAMRSHGVMKDKEVEAAAWEAVKGAFHGALTYGAGMVVLGGLGYAFSPLYRKLTIQFKVWVSFSFLFIVIGGVLCDQSKNTHVSLYMYMHGG